MKIEVDLSDLRAAVTSAMPHMAKPNTPAGENGLGVVRLELTASGLLVTATDQWSLAASLIEAEIHDDEADPIDLTPASLKALLAAFPAPGKDTFDSPMRVESWTGTTSDHAPATVTFTDAGGMFEGNSLTLTEYPVERFPRIATALAGLLALQASDPVPGVRVSAELLGRFAAAAKAFASPLEVRQVRAPEGADRGVLLVACGDRFIGSMRAELDTEPELDASTYWLRRLPGDRPKDPFEESLVWTTSTKPADAEPAGGVDEEPEP